MKEVRTFFNMISRLYFVHSNFVQWGVHVENKVLYEMTQCVIFEDYNLMCSRFTIQSTNLPRDKWVQIQSLPSVLMKIFKTCFIFVTDTCLSAEGDQLFTLSCISFILISLLTSICTVIHRILRSLAQISHRQCKLLIAAMFLPVREYMTVSRGSKTKCVRWWKQSLCVVCRTFVPFWYYCHSWFSFYSTCKLSDCCHQLLLLWSFLKFLSILRFINWIQFTTFPPQPYNQTETDVFIPRV